MDTFLQLSSTLRLSWATPKVQNRFVGVGIVNEIAFATAAEQFYVGYGYKSAKIPDTAYEMLTLDNLIFNVELRSVSSTDLLLSTDLIKTKKSRLLQSDHKLLRFILSISFIFIFINLRAQQNKPLIDCIKRYHDNIIMLNTLNTANHIVFTHLKSNKYSLIIYNNYDHKSPSFDSVYLDSNYTMLDLKIIDNQKKIFSYGIKKVNDTLYLKRFTITLDSLKSIKSYSTGLIDTIVNDYDNYLRTDHCLLLPMVNSASKNRYYLKMANGFSAEGFSINAPNPSPSKLAPFNKSGFAIITEPSHGFYSNCSTQFHPINNVERLVKIVDDTLAWYVSNENKLVEINLSNKNEQKDILNNFQELYYNDCAPNNLLVNTSQELYRFNRHKKKSTLTLLGKVKSDKIGTVLAISGSRYISKDKADTILLQSMIRNPKEQFILCDIKNRTNSLRFQEYKFKGVNYITVIDDSSSDSTKAKLYILPSSQNERGRFELNPVLKGYQIYIEDTVLFHHDILYKHWSIFDLRKAKNGQLPEPEKLNTTYFKFVHPMLFKYQSIWYHYAESSIGRKKYKYLIYRDTLRDLKIQDLSQTAQ